MCLFYITILLIYIYVHHVHNHDNVVHDVYHVFITEQIQRLKHILKFGLQQKT